jgi:hypothetical protein
MSRRRITDAQLLRKAVQLGDPESALVAIAELRRRLDALEAAHIDDALRLGWSWQRIGMALGITRQAAHTRHATRRRDDERLPVAGRARVVLARARHEAARLGAPAIESDHLLLALALEADGPAADAISACSLSDESIRAQLIRARGQAGALGKVQRPSLSHQALAVLEDALREALGQGAEELDCDHLLLAVLREPGGRGQRLVMELGKTPRAAERRLNRAREKRATREATPVSTGGHALRRPEGESLPIRRPPGIESRTGSRAQQFRGLLSDDQTR